MTSSNVTPTPAGTALPPTEAVYFYHREGDQHVSRVIYGLKGVCDALDNAQPRCGDMDALNRVGNLAAAASVLADQLYERVTSEPPPMLRAVPASGGAA